MGQRGKERWEVRWGAEVRREGERGGERDAGGGPNAREGLSGAKKGRDVEGPEGAEQNGRCEEGSECVKRAAARRGGAEEVRSGGSVK